MKKKIVAMCATVALAALAVGGTLAYFTDTEVKENTFTIGNVDITLTEPAWDDEGKAQAETVYPGEPLAKDPTVENVGANPCFVRIEVTGLDQFGANNMITLRHGNYEAGFDSTNWTYYNGYYYYNEVLAAEAELNNGYNDGLGTKTEPLFNQIVMPFGLDGTETAEDIVVTAQAVQAQGAMPSYSEVKSMTVEQIAAWFTTCGF